MNTIIIEHDNDLREFLHEMFESHDVCSYKHVKDALSAGISTEAKYIIIDIDRDHETIRKFITELRDRGQCPRIIGISTQKTSPLSEEAEEGLSEEPLFDELLIKPFISSLLNLASSDLDHS